MPTPRPSRPPPRERASPELIRLVRDNWPIIEWKNAAHREACALAMTGPGPWHITREHHDRARAALIARGVTPPPGFSEPGF
jgi:hypothetical protein